MPLRAGEIPIFVYHEVDPDVFGRDLAFLRENGYRTLTTEELVRRRNTPGADRAVLLTVDDAPRNFWDVALPLLRRFDAHATLFAPTAWMGGASGSPGTGPDVAPSGEAFMTWEELRACDRSGLVDVQSHAHRHALVYTSATLVDFASPALLARHHLYDWPMRRAGGRDVLGRPPLGAPIYESTPLLSAGRRVIENEEVVKACVGHVAAGGGEAWFTRRGWRQELLGVHDRATGAGRRPVLVTGDEFDTLLESEFLRSKRLFEAELGRAPRYVAYPWMLGSPRSLELAARSGIEAVFGVGFDFRRARRLNGALPAFGRTKGEWLRFLPGRGRSRLAAVLPRKIGSFFREQHLAH